MWLIITFVQSVLPLWMSTWWCCWSQWPRGLSCRSAAALLLRLWVRIPLGAWMSVVSVVCCQVEVSAMSWLLVQSRPWPTGAAHQKQPTTTRDAMTVCPCSCPAVGFNSWSVHFSLLHIIQLFVTLWAVSVFDSGVARFLTTRTNGHSGHLWQKLWPLVNHNYLIELPFICINNSECVECIKSIFFHLRSSFCLPFSSPLDGAVWGSCTTYSTLAIPLISIQTADVIHRDFIPENCRMFQKFVVL